MPRAALAALLCALAATAVAAPAAHAQKRESTTTLMSRALDGGIPNGPSVNPVISTDLRYSQLIAFESLASDLVSGDTNRTVDVFAIRRTGTFENLGTPWSPGPIQLVSRGLFGAPANGPSWGAAVNGAVHYRGRCVAFLSRASNLVSGDTNGVADAFLAKAPDFVPKRVSQANDTRPVTDVAVSGDCKRVAFVRNGGLYVTGGGKTYRLNALGNEADPSFATDETRDLVFGAREGVYLSTNATGTPKLVARGGRNPSFNNRKRNRTYRRKVVAYERKIGGAWQIAFRIDFGKERIATSYGGKIGNGDSRDVTVVNSGYNFGFESDATNLPTKTNGERGDSNDRTDAYFFSNTPNVGTPVTILESVDSNKRQLRSGGGGTSTSYYRNYVVFHSAGNSLNGSPQIYMRYLGGI